MVPERRRVNVWLHATGEVEITHEPPTAGVKITRLTALGRKVFVLCHVVNAAGPTHRLWIEGGLGIVARERKDTDGLAL